MADAKRIEQAIDAQAEPAHAPFGLLVLIALTTGVLTGALLCDWITRPAHSPVERIATR